MSPDLTGVYPTVGWLNDKGYGKVSALAKFVWWDGTDSWIISVTLGVLGVAYFKRTDPNIEGTYTPQGTATGTATLTRTV